MVSEKWKVDALKALKRRLNTAAAKTTGRTLLLDFGFSILGFAIFHFLNFQNFDFEFSKFRFWVDAHGCPNPSGCKHGPRHDQWTSTFSAGFGGAIWCDGAQILFGAMRRACKFTTAEIAPGVY